MGVIDRGLLRAVLRAVLTLCVSAVLAAPLAVVWGIGRTEITDYLGANEVTIAVDYTGETRLDLGLLGNAYLPMAYGPVGLTVTAHGFSDGADGSILSENTLKSYLNLYYDPQQAMAGIEQGLVENAVGHIVWAEITLVLIMIGWTQRRRFLSPRLVRISGGRRGVLGYLVVMITVAAVVIAPPARQPTERYDVTVADGTRFAGLTVDSAVLADLLDRGVAGVSKMADRQQASMNDYVDQVTSQLIKDSYKLSPPQPGEQLIFGISDLHCNLAMIRIWSQLVTMTQPELVFSNGDDTMNGTATEKSCVTRERAIAANRPFVDVGGNHDSPITERQMKDAGATVLDGKVTEVDSVRFLGDDDPQYNPPFSTTRIQERNETEAQLGQRMINQAAGRNVDVISVHQPDAAWPIVRATEPPAKLITWGHLHVQYGPEVITHPDGSWTVALQMGTAGGVAAPTITSFSTPFSPPRTSADGYFFYRDRATGLITAVQPVHCMPNGSVVIDDKIPTGDLADLPPETRNRLGGGAATPSPTGTPVRSPDPSQTATPAR
jgi:predicted phosphodiesterase